uniref:Neurotransmitter-gated ion-channel ligand-binding domain-containing protein n=1 Tax=Esox lucius TaxID=8010 RepID=A0AAY5KN51_ESOLU
MARAYIRPGWTTSTTPRGLLYIWMLLLQSGSLGSVAKLNCISPGPEGLISALEKELFPRKHFRPVQSFSTPIDITIYFTLVGVLDVSESEQTVTTFLWQVLQWDIEGLSWDEEQCGTWRVAVPREELWIPDITVAEFCSTNENISPVYPFTYLDNNGHVFDNQPLHVVSACKLSIYSFPFDIQNCTLTFGSYLHFANDIRTVIGRSGEDILKQSIEVLETNREWELIDIIPTHNILELMEGTYDQIIYYVSS